MSLHEILGDEEISDCRNDGCQKDANGIFTLSPELFQSLHAEGNIPLVDCITEIKDAPRSG